MKVEIDRNKCGAEYSLCPQCKFENENDYDKCGYCTMVVDKDDADFYFCEICGKKDL